MRVNCYIFNNWSSFYNLSIVLFRCILLTKEGIIENLKYGSVLILLLSGFLHVISPIFYGNVYGAQGLFIYGLIYIIVGILVAIRKNSKIIGILTIFFPTLGVIVLLPILLPILDAYIIFLKVLDVIVIIIRVYIFIQLFKK